MAFMCMCMSVWPKGDRRVQIFWGKSPTYLKQNVRLLSLNWKDGYLQGLLVMAGEQEDQVWSPKV